MNDNMLYGLRIQKLRLIAGMRQDVLASLLNVTASYLSQVERGKKRPSHEFLSRVANVFNVLYGDLSSETYNAFDEQLDVKYQMHLKSSSKIPDSSVENEGDNRIYEYSWIVWYLLKMAGGINKIQQRIEIPKDRLVEIITDDMVQITDDEKKLIIDYMYDFAPLNELWYMLHDFDEILKSQVDFIIKTRLTGLGRQLETKLKSYFFNKYDIKEFERVEPQFETPGIVGDYYATAMTGDKWHIVYIDASAADILSRNGKAQIDWMQQAICRSAKENDDSHYLVFCATDKTTWLQIKANFALTPLISMNYYKSYMLYMDLNGEDEDTMWKLS